jgi:hypothetical protein
MASIKKHGVNMEKEEILYDVIDCIIYVCGW